MAPEFFVLIGPQGSGKSRKATEIAALLGATSIVDPWDGRSPAPTGALLIMNSPRALFDVLGAAPGAVDAKAA